MTTNLRSSLKWQNWRTECLGHICSGGILTTAYFVLSWWWSWWWARWGWWSHEDVYYRLPAYFVMTGNDVWDRLWSVWNSSFKSISLQSIPVKSNQITILCYVIRSCLHRYWQFLYALTARDEKVSLFRLYNCTSLLNSILIISSWESVFGLFGQ